MVFLFGAITLGFLGSFHCVGMCGPIALALPVGNAAGLKRVLLIFIYNAGRVLTYGFFGALFGLIGQTAAFAGFQQLFSITMGCLILIVLLLPNQLTFTNKMGTAVFSFFQNLRNKLSSLFSQNGARPLFLIGLLNGLLPCGLVYLGAAGAAATGSILNGALFMSFFGLGTIPAMIALPVFGRYAGLSIRNGIRKMSPFIVGAVAILLIVRGLNLGVPYLSPKLGDDQKMTCHVQQTGNSKNTIVCSGQNSAHKK